MRDAFFTSPRRQVIDDSALSYAGITSHSGEVVNENSLLGLSTAWRCISLLSGTVASLPINIYKEDSEGVPRLFKEHPLYFILKREPNYDQTAFDFWHFLESSIEMRGNAYARITRNGAKHISSLIPIHPSFISVTRQPDGALKYRWSENGIYYEGGSENIFHIRGFGGDPLGGLSPLSVGRNVFGNALAADNSSSDMFKNGLKPTGVLTFSEWLNEEQRKIAEENLSKKIGIGNGGMPLILEGGTSWQQITLSPEDAQMLQSRSFSVEEICRIFGVPPHMVGHTENSTSWGTGLEQQTLAFLQFTLRERLKRIEQAINKQLLTRLERQNGVYVSFNLESLLRADSQGRAHFYQVMTLIGAMTINEVRRLENMPPVDGGDTPRIQMQNVPIDQVDNETIRAFAEQIQQENNL
ncbi:HK97 family phage portal protein [Bartonella tamiae Th239]|uniref:HK97 family phage portal protein n=2 Tax=Bartonella tamiae TaxID=373638 RepID=J0R7G1_9HYPH|nr:HK97 family phage portal protein [Bartonella tamiae Th239]